LFMQYALQRQYTENLKQMFPEMKLRFIYSPDHNTYSAAGK
jgi:hypothetical protein